MRSFYVFAALLLFGGSVFRAESPEIFGLFFGDYYYVIGHDPSESVR